MVFSKLIALEQDQILLFPVWHFLDSFFSSFIARKAVLQDTRPARWILQEFTLAHTHSKNKTGKYLITLMLDDIKANEIKDANLKNHVETRTYINHKDLVSEILFLSNNDFCTVKFLISRSTETQNIKTFIHVVVASFW